MTEITADNYRRSFRDAVATFVQARTTNHWESASIGFDTLSTALDHLIRESLRDRIEIEALSAELQLYRPTRDQKPPAPILTDYVYVEGGKYAWACVAKLIRQQVYIPPDAGGGGYFQEHSIPERKTLCKRKSLFPIHERFTSGGWPRLHELCPKCTTILYTKGLLVDPTMAPKTETCDSLPEGGHS